LEYFQQLWNEILEEEAALLESTKRSQVMESKCKEVASKNKERQWLFKKAKRKQLEKYYRGTTVKMGRC